MSIFAFRIKMIFMKQDLQISQGDHRQCAVDQQTLCVQIGGDAGDVVQHIEQDCQKQPDFFCFGDFHSGLLTWCRHRQQLSGMLRPERLR